MKMNPAFSSRLPQPSSGAIPQCPTALANQWRRTVQAIVLVAGTFLAASVYSQTGFTDPPHDFSRFISCSDCHLNYIHPGLSMTNGPGNANVCLSCHVEGGIATTKPRANADQALPGPGLPASLSSQGDSHRWDSSLSGRLSFLGGASIRSSGTVQSSGVYTGRYGKTVTITISSPGNSGTARFEWFGTLPGGGGGTNLLTGAGISVGDGIAVSFFDGSAAPSFQAGDQWHLFLRPRLNPPDNPDLLARMDNGVMSCSTCHNQHSQEKNPFDPGAPDYAGEGTGEGRHLLRMDNDTDQMCLQCHATRHSTNSLALTHPVGMLPLADPFHQAPASLPLDKTEGKIRCSTCHQVHDSVSADGHLLRKSDPVSLCTECHTLANTTTPAQHLSPSASTAWPGGQYGSLYPAMAPDSPERGSCKVCHQIHGWPDPNNPTNNYPSLLVEREENLCFTCHDGSPSAKNIRAVFNQAYSHPATLYSGRHDPAEAGKPASYGQANRHAECTDCHNPHVLTVDASAPTAPAASAAQQGVPRVGVTNVNTTTVNYAYRGPKDPTPAKEYEICFTCHSSWTTQPAGQSNLAAEFNTQNPSFHPVEAAGKNLNINANSFVNGWNGSKLTFCSDCHSSDTGVRGPHGSQFRYLLKKAYTASPAQRTMSSAEICFDCHNYDTYANNNASTTVKGYSRFNPPNEGNGHTYHVGSRRYPCYTCHETHGSTTQPNLIVTGRSPGLNSYTRTANGGSCAPSCHGSQSYTVNYLR